ncbi:hypothetical protein MUK42_18469 [Musa troglodytarum]|uniref:Uncharacterized protein n=1 Tax=Musa troglodytarum TaxID=320322 RepID=A0A9E7G0U5_9LILI|nr:hypothetical protein MUK42_18469 [Musa troglodytarum]
MGSVSWDCFPSKTATDVIKLSNMHTFHSSERGKLNGKGEAYEPRAERKKKSSHAAAVRQGIIYQALDHIHQQQKKSFWWCHSNLPTLHLSFSVFRMGLRKLCQSAMLLCSLVACGLVEVMAQTTLELDTISGTGTEERILVEGNTTGLASTLSARTERVDPLDSFKKYKGGYNITNKHYWSSTVYTGRYGYIIGTIWLVGGLVYACVLLIATKTCLVCKERKQKKRLPCSKKYCVSPVVASGIVLGGSSKFYSRVKSIENIIVETSEEASQTIYNVTQAVVAMESVNNLYGGIEESSNLNSTSQMLYVEAANIQRQAENRMQLVNKGIKMLKVVTIFSIVLNLIAVLVVLALRSLRLYQAFYLFSGDTCANLDGYQLNPQNSTLSSILRCSEHLPANFGLQDIRAEIHDIIEQVNSNISTVKSSILPDLEYICNPFSGPPQYSYQPDNCSSNTIKIGDIPEKYTYSASDDGACSQGEFVSNSNYTRMLVYSMQKLLDGFPRMERLANCQLVKDAFSKILLKECKPLRNYAHLTCAALAVLSTIMVLLVLIVTSEAHHDHKYHSSDGSVRPHLAYAERPFDTTEMATENFEL